MHPVASTDMNLVDLGEIENPPANYSFDFEAGETNVRVRVRVRVLRYKLETVIRNGNVKRYRKLVFGLLQVYLFGNFCLVAAESRVGLTHT